MKTRYWFFPLLASGIIMNFVLPFPFGYILTSFCTIYATVAGVKYGIRKIRAKRKKKNLDFADEYPTTLEEKIRVFKKANVDPYYIDQLILNRCSEGRNIDKNGKEFWVCSHCTDNVKFETREEYVAHHQRVHS